MARWQFAVSTIWLLGSLPFDSCLAELLSLNPGLNISPTAKSSVPQPV